MSGMDVLLAEDNPAHQRLLVLALTTGRPHVRVRTVATGDQLRTALREQHFDCAVVDYNLPDTTADELLGAIRQHLPHCPAIVVSSSDDQGVVISSFRHGSVDFVPKSEALLGNGLWERVQLAVSRARGERNQRRERDRRRRELVSALEKDPLTGLYNRRYLDRRFREGSFRRDRRRAMACIMLDIDHFKQVNDTHGHAVGDAVLKGVAELVGRNLNRADAAIRWGGEEILILKASTDLAEGWPWAEQLREQLARQTFAAAHGRFSVTASMGVTSFPTPQMGQDKIEQADRALYLAKGQGRNRVCTPAMVEVATILDRLAESGSPSVSRRRQTLLTALRDKLGPTQSQHVTGHCRQVAALADSLAEILRLPAAQRRAIQLAGLLHDIGKCVIPEPLLAQTQPLTPQQWAIVRHHAEFGAQLARRLGADETTVEIVASHHSPNYSHTLLGARIVRVADALAAMMTERPYRPARSPGEALAELRNAAGGQFDPAVVAAARQALAVRPLQAA